MSEKADVKSSRMQKGRKTINYLQKLKDEGTPIVQMCPGPRDQFWTMAAEMADVDICRLTVPGDGSDPEMQIKLAPYWIKCVRNAAKIIHINFYMQTPTYASKEAAVANGALYMNCGADSLLPMGITNETLKYKVNEIVDEQEKLPEVAAYYAVWNDLRDTLEGYYKSKPRHHNPLTQQKEFRAIKNAIIQEAERLRQQMEQKSSQDEEPSTEKTSTEASANPTLADENTSSSTSHSVRLPSEYLLNSTVRLFHQMGRIFRDNAAPPSNPMGIRVDSKRRKKLMQKRLAMGHKQDDHEQEQSYGQVIR